MSLNRLIEEFLLERGAIKVRFANRESLAGGPPSADLTYQLEGARSAVSFALPLDRERTRRYLAKEEYHEEQITVSILSSRLSKECAQLLANEGHASARVHGNNKYRTELPGWQLNMHPDISHRYVAVASGLGSFGWSGNVGIQGYGTAVILGTVVTTADLTPTDPIPENESFCDKCKTCVGTCVGGMFSKSEEDSVTLGGRTYTFSRRIDLNRCNLVCGGFTGLHRNGKWSTWSAGRFRVPEKPEETLERLVKSIKQSSRRPAMPSPGGFQSSALGQNMNIRLTCGICSYICFGDKDETRENYRLLTSSGCVIQRENGEKIVLPPEEAAEEFEKMDTVHQALYTDAGL
jgi:epoxyqueuosine reductase QueG